MKLPFPAVAAAAIVLGAALSPALAQDAPAPPPVAQPQAAAPADPQPATPVVRPAGSRGDCAWKTKNLTS